MLLRIDLSKGVLQEFKILKNFRSGASSQGWFDRREETVPSVNFGVLVGSRRVDCQTIHIQRDSLIAAGIDERQLFENLYVKRTLFFRMNQLIDVLY